MKKIIYPIMILLSVFIFGCQKKKYPDAIEERGTTFYSRLMVDGQALDLETGKDNYYMYSSYDIDSSNVYNLVGEFRQSNCDKCPNSLRIQVNAPESYRTDSVATVDSVLQTRKYAYLAGVQEIGYAIKFNGSFTNKNIATINWDFGDGGRSSELNPTHVFQPGKYKVTLVITSTDQNQSTITNTISVAKGADINAFVSATTRDSTVSFTAVASGGIAPYKFLWDFGDGSQGSGAASSHLYTIPGSYGVVLKISDSQQNTKTCYYNTFTSNDASACAANFTFSSPVIVGQRSGSKISIRYTDANGVAFTSDDVMQPGSSEFEILSVDDFVRNENGQAVKKVKMRFNCKVYNGSRAVALQGVEVIAAFAYK